MKRPSPLPTVIPCFRRSRFERSSIALAVIYIVSIAVVLLDVFVWRP